MSDLFITHGNPRFYTTLIQGVDPDEEQLRIPPEDFSAIAYDSRYVTQGDRWLILRSATDREIVRYSSASTYLGEYLSVTRGQGGTIAKTWPKGTKIFCATTADFYERIIQAGNSRVIDYNPNEILAPLYSGEKVYQNYPAGCERWWMSFNATNPYWDLITGSPCGNEVYKDIGWSFDLLIPAGWDTYFNNTHWYPDGPFGTWNAGGWWDCLAATKTLQLRPQGGWQIGYYPVKLRVTTFPATLTNMNLSVTHGPTEVLLSGQTLNSPHEFDLTYYTSNISIFSMRSLDNDDYDLTNLEWQT